MTEGSSPSKLTWEGIAVLQRSQGGSTFPGAGGGKAVCHDSYSFKDWASFNRKSKCMSISPLLVAQRRYTIATPRGAGASPGAPRAWAHCPLLPRQEEAGLLGTCKRLGGPSLERVSLIQRHELTCPFYLLSNEVSSLPLKGHSR